jgi:hypothetical protein
VWACEKNGLNKDIEKDIRTEIQRKEMYVMMQKKTFQVCGSVVG